MRRRRSFLLTVFALGVILVLFFTVGRIGGPSDESERETVAPPPDLPLPLAGTTAEEPAPPAVSGRVVDMAGEGLRGAHVTVVALDDGKRHEVNMRTDPDGRFADRSLRRGKVIYVEVVKKGYPVLRQRPKDRQPGRSSILPAVGPHHPATRCRLRTRTHPTDGNAPQGADRSGPLPNPAVGQPRPVVRALRGASRPCV